MIKNNKIKAVLLFISSMTVMVVAIIAPALNGIADYFDNSSDVLIKLIVTIPALTTGIFGALFGTLSDKIGRKMILIISIIIYGVAGFSGYLINDIIFLLVSRAILGIGVAGMISISTTLIGDYFHGSERSSFMGMQAAFMALSAVVFAIIGGVLADINWRIPFGLHLMAFLILPFVFWFLYEPGKTIEKEISDNNIGKNRRIIVLVYILGFFGMVFYYMIPTQLSFLLKERMDVNNTLVGIALAVSTLAATITSFKYGLIKKKFQFQTIFIFCFFLMAIGYFFIAYYDSYLGIILGITISGFGAGLLIPNCNLWLIELAPVSRRGKIIGGMTSMMYFGKFASPLVFALWISTFNLTSAFYIAVCSMILLTILLLFFNTKRST